MHYVYYHCRQGDIGLDPEGITLHAFLNESDYTERSQDPPAMLDHITRSWCRHFCRARVPHVVAVDANGNAWQIYKHMTHANGRACCPAYAAPLKASALKAV